MKTAKRLVEYPLRTCKSMHHCESCQGTISYGQRYYDGGHGRRAHDLCADADELERVHNSTPYAHVCTGCAHEWNDGSKYYACPWCGEPCSNELLEVEK